MSSREAINRAIHKAGGVGALAKRLDVDQTTVSQWRRRGRVSWREASAVSAATGVSVYALRPDIFGSHKRTSTGTRK